jgi:hypothetical protein
MARRTVIVTTTLGLIVAGSWLMRRQPAPAGAGQPSVRLGWYGRDGQPIAFVSGADAPYDHVWFDRGEASVLATIAGRQGVWRVDLQTGAIRRHELAPAGSAPADARLTHVSRHWTVMDRSRDGQTTLWIAPLDRSSPARAFLGPAPAGSGQLSVDERWMAYVSRESGSHDVYATTFPAPDSRWLVSLPDGGARPVWRSDSQELYYWAPGGRLMVAALRRGDRFVLPALPRMVFEQPSLADAPFAVSRDGRRFLIAAH